MAKVRNISENLSERVKQGFLKPRGKESVTTAAIQKIEQKTYQEENWGEAFFANLGKFIFPLTVGLLSTYGLGAAFVGHNLPVWIAYALAFIIAFMAELGQAVFSRPVMKVFAKKQSWTWGKVLRMGVFSLLSIGLAVFSFYSTFLEQQDQKFADNAIKLKQNADSIHTAFNHKNELAKQQINQLNAARSGRWAGMLTKDERQLQTSLNKNIQTNDSLENIQIAELKRLYPAKPLEGQNVHFSGAVLFKIMIALLACLVLGFLSVYCHYIDFLHSYNIAEESSLMVGYEQDDHYYDLLAAQRSIDYYTEVYNKMPENKNVLMLEASPTNGAIEQEKNGLAEHEESVLLEMIKQLQKQLNRANAETSANTSKQRQSNDNDEQKNDSITDAVMQGKKEAENFAEFEVIENKKKANITDAVMKQKKEPTNEQDSTPKRAVGFVFYKGQQQQGTDDRTDAVIKSDSATKKETEKVQDQNPITANVTKTENNLKTTSSKGLTKDGNKFCQHCQQPYIYSIHNQKFCSDECKLANYKLIHGKDFVPRKRKAPSKAKPKTTKTGVSKAKPKASK